MCTCTCQNIKDTMTDSAGQLKQLLIKHFEEKDINWRDFANATNIAAVYKIMSNSLPYYSFSSIIKIAHHLGYDVEVNFVSRKRQ